jgi:hypothetical protein
MRAFWALVSMLVMWGPFAILTVAAFTTKVSAVDLQGIASRYGDPQGVAYDGRFNREGLAAAMRSLRKLG